MSDAAKLGHPAAEYDLGLLYLQGQQFPQDFKRAAELFRSAAARRQSGGAIRARHHVQRRARRAEGLVKAMRLMGLASIAGNLDAMVEYAIAEFNGTGVPKNEAGAAQLFLKAAHRGSPIAQNRLARILMAGRGMPANPTAAIKWHIVSKAAGASDPEIDLYASKQTPAVRAAAETEAKKWLSTAGAALLT